MAGLEQAAVFGFGDSSSLASAYGVSVTGTMTITTVLIFFVLRFHWKYPLYLSLLISGFFFVIDAAFFSSALMKLLLGGWFPLALGALMAIAMLTWRRGRELFIQQTISESSPLQDCLDALLRDAPTRVPGTAVFLTAAAATTPRSLLHNLKHNKVLHEQVVFLTVVATEHIRGMALWRERLFAAMARNAGDATDYFNIPSGRVKILNHCPRHASRLPWLERLAQRGEL